MVSTRRRTANAELVTAEMERPEPIRQASDTIHVRIPSTKIVGKASLELKAPSTSPSMSILSSAISEHDLSLTSPNTGETPKVLAMSTPKAKQASCDLAERTVSSALRRLAPKPFANMSGSCHNPIIVEETSSPPPEVVRAPKQRRRHKRLLEPHQFIDNGYKDIYSYRVSRPQLAAMPANGSTFTGHQSHDIYRMMNAKIAAAPDLSPSAAWGRGTLNVPFGVPLSAQVHAQQQNQSQYQSQYAQYYQALASTNAYGFSLAPYQNEELLRRRAVQYIQEYPLPSLQKRRLSDADADRTSDNGVEEYQQNNTPQLSASTPQSGSMPPPTVRDSGRHINYESTVYRDVDPNFPVGHLIEHTSLITSLLQLYPHSTDRKGLKREIAMMVQVQNQHVTDWMNTESKNSRKRRKDDGGSTISPDNRPQPIMVPPTRIQNEGDNMLRQVFSANADMWQDGGGHSVADVFAVVPVSSPVASSFDGRIIGSTHTPSASITHGLSIHEKTDATGSATTTPTKQIPIFDAYKDMPTTLSMKDMRAKFERPAINPKDKSKNLTNLESPLSRSQNSAATPTKTSLHPANAPITPSPNRISSPSSSHGDLSTRREHATKQHPAPSAADDDDEVHVSNNGKASSSFQSESSNGSRIRRPVFRFQRRIDAVDERVGADLLLKE